MNYPAIVYRGGVLSANPADQRLVHNDEAELAAVGDGFERWHTKPVGSEAPGVTAPDVAAAQSFANADKRDDPEGDAEIDEVAEQVRARRRGRR